MRGLAIGVVVAALALPAAAAPAQSKPLFDFGRTGGTRAPFEATIAADGTVSVTGGVRSLGPVTLTKPALQGLLRLAKTVGFWSLPSKIRCPGPGGLVTEYLRIHTATQDKRVDSFGGCRLGFEQLYAVVKAAAGLQ
jgi:hypothetical protein